MPLFISRFLKLNLSDICEFFKANLRSEFFKYTFIINAFPLLYNRFCNFCEKI